MAVNYDRLFEEEISEIDAAHIKPRLLLHVCCAPCASAVLERLQGYFDITVFFYNPNITPKEEYGYRLFELERFLKETKRQDIKIIAAPYNEEEFYSMASGSEDLPEGGERCKKCYELRLKATAEYAENQGFDYFCTTLSVSPHKKSAWLNQIGKALEAEYGIKYLCSDFKKKEGYKRSIELSKTYNLYRQNYCGCVFSKRSV